MVRGIMAMFLIVGIATTIAAIWCPTVVHHESFIITAMFSFIGLAMTPMVSLLFTDFQG